MRWLLNIVYLLLLTSLSPFIVWRVARHGRYRRGIAEKLFGRLPSSDDSREAVWFHAVSVGEVIQLQKVVDEFRRESANRFRIVVSTSTDTGFELAVKRFPECQVTWFPLDFSWAVQNAVRSIQPRMVVLMDGGEHIAHHRQDQRHAGHRGRHHQQSPDKYRKRTSPHEAERLADRRPD